MRLWLNPRSANCTRRGITAGDVVGALREQNLQVAAAPWATQPAASVQDFSVRLTEPLEFENVIVKAGKGAALVRVRDVGRVAGRNSANLRFAGLEPPAWLSSSCPRGQRAPGLRRRDEGDGTPQAELPARLRVARGFRQRGRRPRVEYEEVLLTLGEAMLVVLDHVPVPAELAQRASSGHRHPGLPRRHLRPRAALQLLDQRPDAVRDRARHRHRGRRRDRGDREHRAPHARGEKARLSAAFAAMREVFWPSW